MEKVRKVLIERVSYQVLLQVFWLILSAEPGVVVIDALAAHIDFSATGGNGDRAPAAARSGCNNN